MSKKYEFLRLKKNTVKIKTKNAASKLNNLNRLFEYLFWRGDWIS